MSITKPKTKIGSSSISADQFISAAPDGKKARGIKKGNKEQISITIAPILLDKVDALAVQLGQSRAAVISMAIYQAVESGLAIVGKKS
jgi:hypothetical protein